MAFVLSCGMAIFVWTDTLIMVNQEDYAIAKKHCLVSLHKEMIATNTI